MNWTQIEGKWEQLKGDVKSEWGKLTDNDLGAVKGNRDQLVGKIVERYGVLKEKAQQDVDAWTQRMRVKLDKVGKSHDRS